MISFIPKCSLTTERATDFAFRRIEPDVGESRPQFAIQAMFKFTHIFLTGILVVTIAVALGQQVKAQ